MLAVPLLPSLVGVIVAEPAITPVTKPAASTMATAGLLLPHVTTRPVSVLPAESFVTADNCLVPLMAMLAEAGLTVTEATGTTMTVMAAVPLLPSLVGVIVAAPALTPVTRPVPLTVATPVLLLAHATTRPVSVVPAASFVTADSCCVPPTAMLADAGLTVTEATGTVVTVRVAVPLWPSLVAVIVADPTALGVTKPLALTAATAALFDAQVTTRPGRGPPVASLGTAVSCVELPTVTVAAEGGTATEATGARVAGW